MGVQFPRNSSAVDRAWEFRSTDSIRSCRSKCPFQLERTRDSFLVPKHSGPLVKDRFFVAVVALALLGTESASGQTVDFRGRQIKVLIGFGSGGGYDQYGRLIAAHIGRHLPGSPIVLPQNIPGGGSLVVAQKIYAQSPKDGTEWGILARDLITAPLTQPGVGRLFDARKFSWLGSPDSETNLCIANASSGIRTAQDLLIRELVVAATGVGAGSYIYPTVLNGLVKTRFKVVNGYPSSTDAFLAMERHEVEGACDSYSSIMRKSKEAIKNGEVRVLFWAGHPIPEARNWPHVTALVTRPDDQRLLEFMYAGQTYARPFVAPPALPQAVYETLKTAFAETLNDPAALADAARQGMDIRPVGAEETAAIVDKAYATPQPLIDRMSAILRDAGR
jgi:tripartite-type tricarboxylate transporter receptor subunit TctC